MKERIRRHYLFPVLDGEGIRVDEVKGEAKRYFEEKFKEDAKERPLLQGVEFKQLTKTASDDLEEEFSKKEIKKAISDSGWGRSPGPDGFNFSFLKKCCGFYKKIL